VVFAHTVLPCRAARSADPLAGAAWRALARRPAVRTCRLQPWPDEVPAARSPARPCSSRRAGAAVCDRMLPKHSGHAARSSASGAQSVLVTEVFSPALLQFDDARCWRRLAAAPTRYVQAAPCQSTPEGKESAMQITVLGAGAWGTALAIAFADAHPSSCGRAMPSRFVACRASARTRATCRVIAFPPALTADGRRRAATRDADLVLIAAPLAGLRTTCSTCATADRNALPVGLQGSGTGTGLLPHQVVQEVLGERLCGALTGPSFAEELARGLPTVVTIASTDADFALFCAEICAGRACASTPATTSSARKSAVR
jgi:hypothetical protein